MLAAPRPADHARGRGPARRRRGRSPEAGRRVERGSRHRDGDRAVRQNGRLQDDRPLPVREDQVPDPQGDDQGVLCRIARLNTAVAAGSPTGCRWMSSHPAVQQADAISFRPAARPVAATLVALVLALPACATMRYGTEQRVTVESQPSGATVFVGANPVGVTPTEVELQRDQLRSVLTVCKDGFEPVEARFERTISKWLWADVAMATWTGIISGQGVARPEQQVFAFASMLALTVGLDFVSGAILRAPRTVRATLLSPTIGGVNHRQQCSPAVQGLRGNGAAAPAQDLEEREEGARP